MLTAKKKPQVYAAIEEAKIPYRKAFKFNNSALYSEDGDEDDEDSVLADKRYWEMGGKSFSSFLTEFVALEVHAEFIFHEKY